MVWYYYGDVDIEHGGFFYDLETNDWDNGFFDVVRVTPASHVGGPNNQFLIEALTGLVPDTAKSLRFCVVFGAEDDTEAPTSKHVIAAACIAYGKYDPANCFPDHHSTVVQVGKRDEYMPEDNPFGKPSMFLGKNTDLREWIKQQHGIEETL